MPNSLSEATITFILKAGKNWERKLSGQSKVNRQNIIANLHFSITYTERNGANYNGTKNIWGLGVDLTKGVQVLDGKNHKTSVNVGSLGGSVG